ncbi:hypothetical protein ED733_003898 [Metarhizium rileyi]|uniref:F-box domain-containing protein n=1 Tax=Metarhizium rileyi (strain RCEF 4871) TaxID=1649241 RepID=A0A5C6G4V0_METRR|nr:hypothetical protein ED733_003898 [Metarhizium rileyi]
MDLLPPELVHDVLLRLPPSSRSSTRLTSRLFNVILAPLSFTSLGSFVDSDSALSKLEAGACEARRRQRTSIWSPSCSVPEHLPIPQSFLLAAYVAFRGRQWLPSVAGARKAAREWDADSGISLCEDDVDSDSDVLHLTVDKLVDGLERQDITEDSLRAAMFRYALYLSYLYQGTGEAPSLWVFNENVWECKE